MRNQCILLWQALGLVQNESLSLYFEESIYAVAMNYPRLLGMALMQIAANGNETTVVRLPSSAAAKWLMKVSFLCITWNSNGTKLNLIHTLVAFHQSHFQLIGLPMVQFLFLLLSKGQCTRYQHSDQEQIDLNYPIYI